MTSSSGACIWKCSHICRAALKASESKQQTWLVKNNDTKQIKENLEVKLSTNIATKQKLLKPLIFSDQKI